MRTITIDDLRKLNACNDLINFYNHLNGDKLLDWDKIKCINVYNQNLFDNLRWLCTHLKIALTIKYTTPDNHWERYIYDTNGNPLRYQNSNRYWKIYTYDSNGNLLKHEDVNNKWKVYTYDSNGNLLICQDDNNNWEKYTYDSNGKLLTSLDSNGRLKTYTDEIDITKFKYDIEYI